MTHLAGVATGALLGRRRDLAAGILLCLLAAPAAQAQNVPADRIGTLPALIDTTVPKLLARQHIAGTAVAVVHNGRVVMLRGYGRAHLSPDLPVDAERTLFRVGSVTKVVTAIAALQLVDTGKADLHQDTRRYLPDLPMRYGASLHQLLTHTAGFDERFAGAYTDAAHIVPLAEHLRLKPPEQVMRPGRAYSYSNYNYALAGLVIEALSGSAFDRYLDEHVFRPLKMTATSAQQPPPPTLAASVARGYRWTGETQQPLDYRYTYASPSGAMAASAADMGRLMLVLLGDGALDGARLLSPASAAALSAAQFASDPHLSAVTYGFSHLLWHGHRLVYRGGTLGDQAAMLILVPETRLGVFVASNSCTRPWRLPLRTDDDAPLRRCSPVTARPDDPGRRARTRGTIRRHLSRLPPHPQRHVSSTSVDADDPVARDDGRRRGTAMAGPAVGRSRAVGVPARRWARLHRLPRRGPR